MKNAKILTFWCQFFIHLHEDWMKSKTSTIKIFIIHLISWKTFLGKSDTFFLKLRQKFVEFKKFHAILHYITSSTCPPKIHANRDSSYVCYLKKNCMVSFILTSYTRNTIKSFNMACIAMRSRVLSNSHFLAKFAMLHRCQTPYFEGIKMMLNLNIYRNLLLFSIHLK